MVAREKEACGDRVTLVGVDDGAGVDCCRIRCSRACI